MDIYTQTEAIQYKAVLFVFLLTTAPAGPCPPVGPAGPGSP